MRYTLIIVICCLYSFAYSEDFKTEIWSLQPQDGLQRRFIIRDKTVENSMPVYHVEVLENDKTKKNWPYFHRLSKHMAITEAALHQSEINRLEKGNVYPESFEDAYKEWKISRKATENAPICVTSIEQCLKTVDEQK